MSVLAIEWRLLLALIVPPVPSLFFAMLAVQLVSGDSLSITPILGIAVLGSILFGFPAMFLIGLPTHVLLKNIRQRSMLSYSAAGIMAGALTVLIISGIDARPYDLFVWSLGVTAGLLNAATFWLIRRPDCDQASPASGNETSA